MILGSECTSIVAAALPENLESCKFGLDNLFSWDLRKSDSINMHRSCWTAKRISRFGSHGILVLTFIDTTNNRWIYGLYEFELSKCFINIVVDDIRRTEPSRKTYCKKLCPEAIERAKRKLNFSTIGASASTTREEIMDPLGRSIYPMIGMPVEPQVTTLGFESKGHTNRSPEEADSQNKNHIHLKSVEYNFDFEEGRPFSEEECAKFLKDEPRYEWTKVDQRKDWSLIKYLE